MKAVFFTPYIDWSIKGESGYLLSLKRELGRLMEVHIVSFATEPSVYYARDEHTHYISSSILFGKMKREWQSLLQQLEPDLVHLEDRGMYQSTFILKWAQQLGYKVVLSPQGMELGTGLRLFSQKRMLDRADSIVVASEAEQAMLSSYGYAQKTAVIAYGVDLQRMKVKTYRNKRKKILAFNRIGTEEEMEMLIEAVSSLRRDLKEYRIAIIDEGAPRNTVLFKEMMKEEQVEHLFDFYENISKEKERKLLQESALYIFLSGSADIENSVPEALAYGTPVVATQETPWQELETNHCGWWVKTGTRALADAIKQYLQMSGMILNGMGRNGRKLAEEKYSCTKTAKNLFDLYSQIKELPYQYSNK